MPILIVIAKLGIIASYASIFFTLSSLSKVAGKVKYPLDLLSRLEVCCCVGLALVGLVAVITPETYMFTILLCLLSIALSQFERYRFIFAGNGFVLLGGKVMKTKDVVCCYTRMFTFHVTTKKKKYCIYVPLSSSEVIDSVFKDKVKK